MITDNDNDGNETDNYSEDDDDGDGCNKYILYPFKGYWYVCIRG